MGQQRKAGTCCMLIYRERGETSCARSVWGHEGSTGGLGLGKRGGGEWERSPECLSRPGTEGETAATPFFK
jgi:hypothetical protein